MKVTQQPVGTVVTKNPVPEAAIEVAPEEPKKLVLTFQVTDSFPVLERKLKERYLRAVIKSRLDWPRGRKEIAEATGLSAPTITAWCAEFDIPLPF